MASIISGNINLSKINKDKIYEGKKGKYYPVTVVINNEVGEYGDSGYIMTEQTKDERDASIPKEYLGNVKVIWTDGQNVDTANKNVASPTTAADTFESKSNEPDLPF
tara:strand:+ start:933 stop:1253 length:321 start_codon:yes stop_codon:yes gene_type:complete